jgi:hypothetical protein
MSDFVTGNIRAVIEELESAARLAPMRAPAAHCRTAAGKPFSCDDCQAFQLGLIECRERLRQREFSHDPIISRST